MQKVLAINLNGRAYHVEEPGYDALVAYLDRAGARLADNPDRSEILGDLEQAIAEKCDRLLGPHKTVVTDAEIDRILTEMGPVDAGDDDTAAAADSATGKGTAAAAPSPKRLYQIREGAMISGLCAGTAAYLSVDVTIVRVVFVLLAFLTKGAWLLVYGVLMLVIPYAETSEQHAAASGRPFTAQELIEQAKRNIADFRKGKKWRRHRRRQQRAWQWQWHSPAAAHLWNQPPAYASPGWVGASAPFFGLINAALVLALIFALFSLVTTRAVAGVALPDGWPLWAGVLIVVGIYQFVALPVIAMHRAAMYPYGPGPLAWTAPLSSLIGIGLMAFGLWYGYQHVPAMHDAIETVMTALRNTVNDLQAK